MMNVKKLLYFVFISTLVIALGLVGLYHAKLNSVEASEYYVLCHNNPAQSITLVFNNQQSYEGHLGLPHNDQVYDTEGECEEDFDICPLVDECVSNPECLSFLQEACEEEGEVEGFNCSDLEEFCEVPHCTLFPNDEECQEPRDVCENLEGVQAEVPQGYHLEDGQCILDEEPEEPEVPTEIVSLQLTGASAPPVCNATPLTQAPIYSASDYEVVDGDTIIFRWSAPADDNAVRYGIHYGYEKNNLGWYTGVEGNDATSAEVNGLDTNRHIWRSVCGINACGDPICGESLDP